MSDTIILDTYKPKSIFGQKLFRNENDLYKEIVLPQKRKHIKRFVKTVSDQVLLLKNRKETISYFCENLDVYKEISPYSLGAIINKLCKITAEKFMMTLPFDEIFIIAPEMFDYSLILPLINLCKMFTIVSDNYDLQKADEMYFKYGCIIRHKENIEVFSDDKKIVICGDERTNCENFRMPVINLSEREYLNENIINIHNVKVSDEQIRSFSEVWGGVSGLELYTLLGIIPDKKAGIDINVKADKIFLLDITSI